MEACTPKSRPCPRFYLSLIAVKRGGDLLLRALAIPNAWQLLPRYSRPSHRGDRDRSEGLHPGWYGGVKPRVDGADL
jgi:hypothetical protein